MKRLLTILFTIHCVLAAFAQYTTSDDVIYKGKFDERCIDLMGVPLEGPDSAFVPALKSIGLEQFTPEDPDPGDYYFRGEFYGIRANFVVQMFDEFYSAYPQVKEGTAMYRAPEDRVAVW